MIAAFRQLIVRALRVSAIEHIATRGQAMATDLMTKPVTDGHADQHGTDV